MRHIFKCVECGADFVKVDASVLCEVCRNKPPKVVEPVVVEVEVKPEPETAPVIEQPKPKKSKSKSAGGDK